jgi:hypothetical protein
MSTNHNRIDVYHQNECGKGIRFRDNRGFRSYLKFEAGDGDKTFEYNLEKCLLLAEGGSQQQTTIFSHIS